jgi:hypothetical protein
MKAKILIGLLSLALVGILFFHLACTNANSSSTGVTFPQEWATQAIPLNTAIASAMTPTPTATP